MGLIDLLPLIISGLSALGITAGGLWLRRENKRLKSAEADGVETNNAILAGNEWRGIAEHREEKLKLKDQKIDDLYIQIGEWRDKYNDKVAENSELRVAAATTRPRICNKPGCHDREPQTGF